MHIPCSPTGRHLAYFHKRSTTRGRKLKIDFRDKQVTEPCVCLFSISHDVTENGYLQNEAFQFQYAEIKASSLFLLDYRKRKR